MSHPLFRADLHTHTTASDGTFSPAELLHHAVEVGLSGLSITDHDTLLAYEEALPLAEELSLPLLPGVEFSTLFQATSIHLLGYAFTSTNKKILELCKNQRMERSRRNQKIVEKLASQGMAIDLKELEEARLSAQVIGRPHLAELMVRGGYVSTLQEAFDRWIGEGKPCYEPGQRPTTEEAIEMIHEAGGVAVLAHPHLLPPHFSPHGLLRLPFDGIEGWYGRVPKFREKRWIQEAKERGWLVTGGSDFHGAIKPHLPLGCSWIGEETFSFLMERYRENLKREALHEKG